MRDARAYLKYRAPFILLLFIGLFYPCEVGAQYQYQPQSFLQAGSVLSDALLSPDLGVSLVDGHFFWTNDNGKVWTDVSPPGESGHRMLTYFFLDSAHWWIVSTDSSTERESQPPVRILRTEDGGRTWAARSFEISSYQDLKNLTIAPEAVQFVDAQHGWFQWRVQTSAAFSGGVLFRTSDGGATWTELRDLPSAREFRFQTPLDGWIVGHPNDHLDVTHDGGESWQPTSVPPPTNCRECIPSYFVPKFQDPNNGTLLVLYRDFKSAEERMVHATYVTKDGGNSWQNTETFERDRQDILGARIFSSLVGDHAIYVTERINIRGVRVRRAGRIMADSTPAGLPQGSIIDAQFVDDLNGWVRYAYKPCVETSHPAKVPGRCAGQTSSQLDLLATVDGGRTFTVITPHLSDSARPTDSNEPLNPSDGAAPK